MPVIRQCSQCGVPLERRYGDSSGDFYCPSCGASFPGEGLVIDVTAETPDGEIVGLPASQNPRDNFHYEHVETPEQRAYRFHLERRAQGCGCCGPGCLAFFLLFFLLFFRGCL